MRLKAVDSGQMPVRENGATLNERAGAMIRCLH